MYGWAILLSGMVVLVIVRDVVVTALRSWAEFRNQPVVTSVQAKYKTLLQNVFAYLVMVLIFLQESALFGDQSVELIGRSFSLLRSTGLCSLSLW